MRRAPTAFRRPALMSACILLAAACSGAADPTATAPPTSATSLSPAATATPAGSAEDPATPSPTLAPSEPFSTATISLEGDRDTIRMPVYVADTPALRARGLMERESLPAGTGMVFLYDEDTTGMFWMRDTLLPLSIAFADADGVILDIQDMEPCPAMPCPQYGPGEPYRTALEVPQGWFADAGVVPGWRITELPAAAAG